MNDATADLQTTRRVLLGGDLMLGRNVKAHLLRFGPGYPLGPVAPLLRAADLTLVNLECALTASVQRWPGLPKAYYFGAPPQAIDTLTEAGIDLVSLANNHVLDFGLQGLHETLHLLTAHGIRTAGAGADLDAALAPAIIDCRGVQFGMVALCDHQADFAATRDSPGIAFLDLDDEPAALAALHALLQPLLQSNPAVDWPILSLHWGPNMVLRPSARFRRLAHAAVMMGWKIVYGHSAHVFQGIEIYRGCPIIYAAGDLVDDYAVDPDFQNDHQLLIELHLTRERLQRITLHPIFIEHCQVRPAAGNAWKRIVGRMNVLCKEMGTRVQQGEGAVWIEV